MKKIIVFSVFSALLLVACTWTQPNIPDVGNPIPVVPFKIKQIKALSYSYRATKVGCSEIEFLKTFVGKKVKTDKGFILVDNIMDIHMNVSSSHTYVGISGGGISGDEQFECTFWGMAVEYEK